MDIENRITLFYITEKGLRLSERLRGLYPHVKIFKFSPEAVPEAWHKSSGLIFIMASGIVVRTIATLIKDKKTDPAVIVLDEEGRFAISLLSGHIGGANEMAREIARFLGGDAVITTASDINNLTPIDLWAKEKALIIENWGAVPKVSTKFLNSKKLKIYSELDIPMPDGFIKVDAPDRADVVITNKIGKTQNPNQLYLRPRNLVIGIGCNSLTPAEEIEEAVRSVLKQNNLSFLSIHSIATIDIKGNEKGLKEFVERYGFKIKTYTPDELNAVVHLQPSAFNLSDAAFNATGAYAVSEPAALLASGASNLLVPKQKFGNVTVAVAEVSVTVRQSGSATEALSLQPKVYIVGTGPGSIEHITPYAQKVIRNSDVIVGYGTYLDLIHPLIKDKEVVTTGMTQEIDRCKKAVELALSGKTVSIISGGDPGIYAMAGLVLEIVRGHESRVKTQGLKIEVVPGISALNACAARLGAPLMHDFAVISLSDRLTPWELIEKRLEAAAKADFITVLYNPRSKGRPEHLKKAIEIFLRYRDPDTPVGIVKAAMRDNEDIIISSLKDMPFEDIDMQTTVIIGNSSTYVWNRWMITPRGYERKMHKK